MLAEVVVQHRGGEVGGRSLALEAEQARSARILEEGTDCGRELGVDDRRPHEQTMLGLEAEGDTITAHARVTLREGGDPVGTARPRRPLRAHAKPGAVDEGDGERAGPLALQGIPVEVILEIGSQRGEVLSEANEALVLLLLPGRTKGGMVEVLSPARAVDSGGLELRPGVRGDPHVPPRRRDRERLDALERGVGGDGPTARIDVAKALAAEASPSAAARHGTQSAETVADA